MSKQYSPACYYWDCLNHVKQQGKFCSRYCMEEFVETPPPWIKKEDWNAEGYARFRVEEEKKKTVCHWCGKPTFKTVRGKARKPRCSKCVVKLREVYYQARGRCLPTVQKCKQCNGYTNKYYKGRERPPYCSDCLGKGIIS